jgi:hypothetical protein
MNVASCFHFSNDTYGDKPLVRPFTMAGGVMLDFFQEQRDNDLIPDTQTSLELMQLLLNLLCFLSDSEELISE